MNHFSQTSFTDSGDIHDKQRIEAEDYEELIAEIAERLEVNVEFVTVDCGTRGVALATGVSDIVFWMEIGDWNNFEGSDFEDQPENTIATESYMSVPLWWAVLSNSPVVNVYRDQ